MQTTNRQNKEIIPVFEISRMAIHNGPGMRTMVHLKGCPLRCVWCSTPESQRFPYELSYKPEKCIGCYACIKSCPQAALSKVAKGKLQLDRKRCDNCGFCVRNCCSKALQVIGEDFSAEDLYKEIIKDRLFYETTNGGVTFSGGEPLQNVNEELMILLQMLKAENISIIFDTSGFVSIDDLNRVLPYADYFLWDLKQMDCNLHKRFTGVDNKKILANLKYVDTQGIQTYLRCPIITGINDNDTHIEGIFELVQNLEHVKEIDLLPLHHLGSARYEALGRRDLFAETSPPEDDQLQFWKARLMKTEIPVRIIN